MVAVVAHSDIVAQTDMIVLWVNFLTVPTVLTVMTAMKVNAAANSDFVDTALTIVPAFNLSKAYRSELCEKIFDRCDF